MNQSEIFEETTGKTKAIIIKGSQKNLLSKQQQTFNRLVARIEKLKLQMEETNKTLTEKLKFYGKNIHPIEQQLYVLNTEMIKQLFRFYKNKELLSKKDRQQLKRMISNQVDEVLQLLDGDPDEEIKSIFKAVNGLSFEDAKEEDFGLMKNDLQNMFNELGIDLDLNEVHSKMTEQEILKRMMEMKEQILQKKRENDFKRPSRKKAKRQIEKEEREKQVEEAKTKNIGSIYRQLAKIFHPDLERDPDMKIEKEELMKQLTVAYQKSDLHTLLSLELAWIQKEENSLVKLADEKLSIYNEVLKVQVRDLENQINMEINHPRYQPLQRFAFYGEIKKANLTREKKTLEQILQNLQAGIVLLKGDEKQSLSTVKRLIREFKEEDDFGNEFPIFN